MLNLLYYYNVEAIEIFQPYIEKYNLKSMYKEVYYVDAIDFDYSNKNYKLIILGDIIEHLSEEQARVLLNKLFLYTDNIIISVPYNSVQGEEYGNIHEIHLQPALNKERFEELYPEFICIWEEKKLQEHIAIWLWTKLKEVE